MSNQQIVFSVYPSSPAVLPTLPSNFDFSSTDCPYVILPKFDDIISSYEFDQLQTDCVKGNIKCWLDKYPEYVNDIYLYFFYIGKLTNKTLKMFIEKGFDINGNYFLCSNNRKCTPIIAALESRDLNNIRCLLKHGAIINDININCNINILDVLLGEDNDEYEDFDEDDNQIYDFTPLEDCLKLLLPHKPILQISSNIRNNSCNDYIKYSKYLKEFIESCEIIN